MALPPIQQWNTGTGGPAGLGAALGTGLGSGLGSGLGKVLDARDTQKGLEAIGYKPDQARKLSFLHPALLQKVIQQGTPDSQKYLKELLGNIQRGYVENPGQPQTQPQEPVASQPQQDQNIQWSRPSAAQEALERLQTSPLERLLNPQSQGPFHAHEVLEQLKKSQYEDLARSIMEKKPQPKPMPPKQQQTAPVPVRKQFTAADVDWSKLNPEQSQYVQKLLDQKDVQKEKVDQQRERIRLAQQGAIDKQNAPFKKRVTDSLTQSKQIVNLGQEIKDLASHPDAQLGAIKSLTPTRFMNATTQALVAKINELVTLKAQLGKGVPSRMRLILEQAAKPQVYQRAQTINYLVDSIQNAAKETVAANDIMNDIIANNEGYEPRHLEGKWDKVFKVYNQLPSPEERKAKEGQKIKAGNFYFVNDQGEWRYIGDVK